jgi:hypothetical protein
MWVWVNVKCVDVYVGVYMWVNVKCVDVYVGECEVCRCICGCGRAVFGCVWKDAPKRILGSRTTRPHDRAGSCDTIQGSSAVEKVRADNTP